jgi:hypothetical protein
MKRVFAAAFLLCLALLAVPAFGDTDDTGAALPPIIEKVIRNRDFFTKPLWSREDCFLFDVNRLDKDRISVDLLAPSGFEYLMVYDVATREVIYSNALVPDKDRREEMSRESIRVTDAVKLAQSVVRYKNEDRKDW